MYGGFPRRLTAFRLVTGKPSSGGVKKFQLCKPRQHGRFCPSIARSHRGCCSSGPRHIAYPYTGWSAVLFSALCCCLSQCKFFLRFRKWGRKVSCYFLLCFCCSPSSGKPIVHLPLIGLHFAPPLLYAKPVTCNRYQTSTCFYYFTSSFTSSFRYTHRHTHTAFWRIVNTLKQVNNPFQMACLSDLFLLVAEIWQEAPPRLYVTRQTQGVYGGWGVAGYPLQRGAALKRYLYIYSDKNQEFERFSTLK